jgi:hypothetical protein
MVDVRIFVVWMLKVMSSVAVTLEEEYQVMVLAVSHHLIIALKECSNAVTEVVFLIH